MYLYWLTRLLPFWWGVGSVYAAALVFDWGMVVTIAALEFGFSWSKYPCTKWGVPIFMPLIPASEMGCLYHVHHVPTFFASVEWNGGILALSIAASVTMEISTCRRLKVWYWYKKHHAVIFAILFAAILGVAVVCLLYAEHATRWKVAGLTATAGYLGLLGYEIWLGRKNRLPLHEYTGPDDPGKLLASPS